jgi:hypothetical protein
LVIYLRIDFKLLERQGKAYRWSRPRACPACLSRRIVGHGYVQRYFASESGLLWMKRYRCLDCKTVLTTRPIGYWRAFLAPVEAIVESLKAKLRENHWIGGWSRQRQQYWWRGFRQRLLAAGVTADPSPGDLRRLLRRAIIVATHSLKYCEVRRVSQPFYRSLAFTAAGGRTYP